MRRTVLACLLLCAPVLARADEAPPTMEAIVSLAERSGEELLATVQKKLHPLLRLHPALRGASQRIDAQAAAARWRQEVTTSLRPEWREAIERFAATPSGARLFSSEKKS